MNKECSVPKGAANKAGMSGRLQCYHYAEIRIHTIQMLYTTPPLTLLPSIR